MISSYQSLKGRIFDGVLWSGFWGGRGLDGFTVSGLRAEVPQRQEDTPKAVRFFIFMTYGFLQGSIWVSIEFI